MVGVLVNTEWEFTIYLKASLRYDLASTFVQKRPRRLGMLVEWLEYLLECTTVTKKQINFTLLSKHGGPLVFLLGHPTIDDTGFPGYLPCRVVHHPAVSTLLTGSRFLAEA